MLQQRIASMEQQLNSRNQQNNYQVEERENQLW